VIEHVRTVILLAAAVGCLVYAFIPPGNPQWIGTAGALLGGEALARARNA
jgi:hypothetical protein